MSHATTATKTNRLSLPTVTEDSLPGLLASIRQRGLIIGGALGNVIDRVRLGAVTDFVDVRHLLAIFPWIFNLADSAISVGVVLLLAESFLGQERKSVS